MVPESVECSDAVCEALWYHAFSKFITQHSLVGNSQLYRIKDEETLD